MAVATTAEKMIKATSIDYNYREVGATSPVGTNKAAMVYAGLTGRVLVGEAVVKGNVLYPLRSVGTVEWKKIDADAIATMPGLAYVLEDAADNTYALVMFDGFIKNTSEDFGVHAAGTLSLATQPTAGDTITIGGRTYEFLATNTLLLTAGCVPVVMGANIGATKPLLVAAINADPYREVTATAFSSDDMVVTALAKGVAGSLIASTTDLTDNTDDFGAATLGDTTEGSEGGLLYGSCTAGGLTLTAPNGANDVVQPCGFAISAEQFFFRPSLILSVVSG